MQFLLQKMEWRHAAAKDFVIFLWLIAKTLFAWSYRFVNGIAKPTVENTQIFNLLSQVNSIHILIQRKPKTR